MRFLGQSRPDFLAFFGLAPDWPQKENFSATRLNFYSRLFVEDCIAIPLNEGILILLERCGLARSVESTVTTQLIDACSSTCGKELFNSCLSKCVFTRTWKMMSPSKNNISSYIIKIKLLFCIIYVYMALCSIRSLSCPVTVRNCIRR